MKPVAVIARVEDRLKALGFRQASANVWLRGSWGVYTYSRLEVIGPNWDGVCTFGGPESVLDALLNAIPQPPQAARAAMEAGQGSGNDQSPL